MANPTVAIDITARLDGLRQELAKMPEIGAAAAKQMTAAMAKDIRSNTTATNALAAQNKKMAESFDQTAVSGNKALKALGPLGGVLSKLDPTAGSLSSSVAGLTSAFEGFEAAGISLTTTTLTPLAAILGVVGIAYVELTGTIDDYTAATKAAKAASDAEKAAMQPLGDAIAAQRKERDLLLQALNSPDIGAAYAAAERQIEIDNRAAAATAGLRKEREGLVEVVKAAGSARTFDSQLAENRIAEIDREIAAVGKQGDELNALQGQTEELRKVASSYTGELVRQKYATDAATSALAKLEEEQKKAAEERKREEAADSECKQTAASYGEIGRAHV